MALAKYRKISRDSGVKVRVPKDYMGQLLLNRMGGPSVCEFVMETQLLT